MVLDSDPRLPWAGHMAIVGGTAGVWPGTSFRCDNMGGVLDTSDYVWYISCYCVYIKINII